VINLKVFNICFVIIGSIVGAGFASGKEIGFFFNIYGEKGMVGILLANIMFFIITYLTFKAIYYKNISTYKEFLDYLLNKKLSFVFNLVVKMFTLLTFYVMIAAVGQYFKDELEISYFLGTVIISVICFIVYLFSLKGILLINTIIVPILIVGIIYICNKDLDSIKLFYGTYQNNLMFSNNAFLSGILYASYNSILLIPVLITLKKYISNKMCIIKSSMISSLVILVLSSVIFLCLNHFCPQILTYEMPMVYISRCFGKQMKIFYGLIILLSIFTTAISLGFSILNEYVKNKKKYIICTALLCYSGVLASQVGFGNLLEIIYPFFGYIGLIQIYLLIKKHLYFFTNMIKLQKKKF